MAHEKSVSGSAAQARLQSTATMQRSFFPGMQLIAEGQLQSGCAHSASGQPVGLKRKPKRAQESSATGGSVESSAFAGCALLVQATPEAAQVASSASAIRAPSRSQGPGVRNEAIRAA